jgi:hypothetical protein
VVDAGGAERPLALAGADDAGQELRGVLDRVAQPDRADPLAGGVPAVDRHRVRVLQEQRVCADLAHVGADLGQRVHRAQTAEDAARPERVADRLIDAVPAGDLDVQRVGVHATHLEAADDDVGAGQRRAAVGGGGDARRQVMRLDDAAQVPLRAGQRRRVDVHQDDVGVAQALEGQEVGAQRQRELEPAGTDDGDGGHAV